MTYAGFEYRVVSELSRAFAPDGLLQDIAQTALVEPGLLSPDDAADVIMPPKATDGSPLPPRFELVESAKSQIAAAAAERRDEIFVFADRVGMRQDETLPQSDLSRIAEHLALWGVEAGANRTSVVRRELANVAMGSVYGDRLVEMQLHQFGSNRVIPRTRADGSPNPEYRVAQEIGGEFLPDIDRLTEFHVGVASAQNGGYEIIDERTGDEEAARVIRAQRSGAPELVLVNPYDTDMDGLQNGFTAVARLIGSSMNGRQWVVVSNGQYRTKDEWQAKLWAREHRERLLHPVALGDEAGFTVRHAGNELTTAARAEMPYVNEGVVLQRMLGL